jgi:hypothetical protein
MELLVNATSQPHYPRRRELTPIVQEAGRALGPILMRTEKLAIPGSEPRTLKTVASRHTDWAIPVPLCGREKASSVEESVNSWSSSAFDERVEMSTVSGD